MYDVSRTLNTALALLCTGLFTVMVMNISDETSVVQTTNYTVAIMLLWPVILCVVDFTMRKKSKPSDVLLSGVWGVTHLVATLFLFGISDWYKQGDPQYVSILFVIAYLLLACAGNVANYARILLERNKKTNPPPT